MAALLLLACSSSQKQPTPSSTATLSSAAPTSTAMPSPVAKRGGRLQDYTQAPTPSLDPVRCTSYACHNRISLVYSRLVKPIKGEGLYDTRIVSDLAESWTTSANGLEWSFNLRRGVRWASLPPVNGRELTSDDVVYSFGLYAQEVDSPWRYRYAGVSEIKALDKYLVRFTLKAPDPQFLLLLASDPSWIVPREVTTLDVVAVGTGPFKIARHHPEVGSFYDKNPDYFLAEQVLLDGVDMRVIPDKGVAIAVFRTGGLDILGYPGQHDLAKSEMVSLAKNTPGVQFDKAFRNLVWSLGVKYECRCPLDKLAVRKAINHSIDRDALIQIMTEGEGRYSDTFPSQTFPDYALPEAELKQLLRLDVPLAKKLLAEAGYPKGFTTPVLYTPAFRQPQYVELEAQMLGESGILLDTKEEQVGYSRWVEASHSGGYSGLAQWGYAAAGFWDYFQGVHHSQGRFNGPRTNIPEVDKAIDDAMRTLDTPQQIAKVRELERKLLTDYLYVIPLHTQPGYLVRQPWVRNLNLGMGAMSGIASSEYMAWAWLDK